MVRVIILTGGWGLCCAWALSTRISRNARRLSLAIQLYYTNPKSHRINMQTKILVIILFLHFCKAERVNYHMRQLYMNQNQHVCMPGNPIRMDLIQLSVDFFGARNYSQVYFADGGSSCSETARRPQDKISPADDWDYYFGEYDSKNISRLRFNQTITIKYEGRFIRRMVSMVATSVIVNPTIINHELWQCEIVGDGGIKPFGLYGKARPCLMFIDCIKMTEMEEIKSQ